MPDPELLDGSSYEPEKRSEYGMLAEFEMGEASENSNQQGDKVGSSGSKDGSGQSDGQEPGGGGTARRGGGREDESEGGGGPKVPGENDPNAKAEGIQVADLRVPEGQQAAAQGDIPGSDKPKEIQIGDATLQIRTLPASTPNVVGTQQQQQGSHNQQYEKGAAAVQQSSNAPNRGVEKGRTMPPGM